jgi:translation initiation factor RLI1
MMKMTSDTVIGIMSKKAVGKVAQIQLIEARRVPNYVVLDNSVQNVYTLFKEQFQDYVTMTNKVLCDVTTH